MKIATQELLLCLSRRLRREEGGATVETVLWMPFFMALFAMVVDVSLVMGGQAEVLRIVQDTNRAVSLGRYQSLEDARQNILTEISQLSSHSTVTLEVVNGIITSVVVIPARDLTATGLFDGLADVDIVVRAEHLSEA